MKLINEKGKLFGIVNLIDLVVVLLILFLAAAAGYKVLSPKIAASPTAQGEVTAVIKIVQRTDNVAKSIQTGQQLVFGTDFINGSYITDVKSEAANVTTNDAQGNAHYVKHPILKDIYVTIKASINTNAPIYKIGSQELCVGKKFTLKTQTIEVDGSVESITLNK